MAYKWKPSKAAAAEFGARMEQIATFCKEQNISVSSRGDSYYFAIGETEYRVSNHTVAASNRGAYDESTGEQIRELYHDGGELPGVVYITAGKTRIIDIYNDLAAGHRLDRRGNRID